MEHPDKWKIQNYRELNGRRRALVAGGVVSLIDIRILPAWLLLASANMAIAEIYFPTAPTAGDETLAQVAERDGLSPYSDVQASASGTTYSDTFSGPTDGSPENISISRLSTVNDFASSSAVSNSFALAYSLKEGTIQSQMSSSLTLSAGYPPEPRRLRSRCI